MTLFLACLAIALVLLALFILDQLRRGRFAASYHPPVEVDAAWFERNVASIPAEVIGVACDDSVDRNDVKALLARMMLEEKIGAEVADGSLRLKLLVPWTALSKGAEIELARAIFVSGEVTHLVALKDHYEKRDDIKASTPVSAELLSEMIGLRKFSALDVVAPPLREAAGGRAQPAPDIVIFVLLVLTMFAFKDETSEWEASMGAKPMMSLFTGLLVGVMMPLHLGSMALAKRAHRKPLLGVFDVLILPIPILIVPLLATLDTSAASVLLFLLFTASLINVLVRARSQEEAVHTLDRLKYDAARRFLERELASERPLPDRWVPYLYAFGLATHLHKEPAAFIECGGVARFNELADIFLAPFPTRPTPD